MFVVLTLLGWSMASGAEPPADRGLAEARKAFVNGEYERTLELVEPLIQAQASLSQVRRLKLLSLVRLGKTQEGLAEYERLSRELGRENEEVLREMAINIILPVRTDMRDQFRGAAYTALKEIHSDEIVPYFEDGLSDGTGMIRALVAEGLGRLPAGQRSKRFREALQDRAGLVRVAVLKGLGRSGNKALIPLITPLLHDEQKVVQVAAAGALFMLGRTEYWDRIQKATEVHEGYERGSALRLLGDLGDPRAIPILARGLHDRQPSIRAAAAASLGKLNLPESVSALLPVLSERMPAVRSVAAVSLGKLKAEEAISPLTEALQDPNPGVRAAAVAGLLRLNSPYRVVASTVRELVQSKNPGLRSSAAKALSNGRSRDVVGTLTLLLHDPTPRPRITAARSLGRVGGRDVIPQLKQALRDSNEAVRATAAGAIARILSQPPET